MSIKSESLDAFRERFGDLLDVDDRLTDQGREELDPNWDGAIHELADGLVPVYTVDIVREWVEAGYPDVDDPGLVEGVTDITRIMSVALYECYSHELCQLAYEAGFDD